MRLINDFVNFQPFLHKSPHQIVPVSFYRKEPLSYNDNPLQGSKMTISLTWHDMLTDGKQQPYPLNTLRTATEGRQSEITIYSPQKDTFNAFHSIELGGVKVVILG